MQPFKSLDKIILAVDNDGAGEGLAEKFTEVLEELCLGGIVKTNKPYKKGTDWNEVLKNVIP